MPRRLLPKGALRTVSVPRSVYSLASLSWELAVPSGLRPAPGSAQWQAGHVTAVVPWGPVDLLIGSHSGGVWQLWPGQADTDPWGALPLSDAWDNPNVSALALDTADHAYAGCFARPQSEVRMYEALPGAGGRIWQPVATSPLSGAGFGTVYGLAITQGRLVCATSTGLRFTTIPPASTPAGSRDYAWTEASWPAGGNPGGLSGLAVAEDGSVVASSLAGGSIWTGRWKTSVVPAGRGRVPVTWLVMTRATTPAVATAARSSLAVCAAAPQRMYAVVGHTATSTGDAVDATIAAVWTSGDSGQTWSSVAGSVTSRNGTALSPLVALVDSLESGHQGDDWNNCIGVSATDPGTVAIGWQYGIFISENAAATDGSASWARYFGATADSALHLDLHVLHFDTRPAVPGRLYVGSDGGLVSTDDLGQTYLSGYNAALSNLQFESFPEREFYGLTSASGAVAGLVAGGLQDNGVVWAIAGPAGQWEEIMGGDGAGTAFLADGSLLGCGNGDGGNAVHLWEWDGGQFTGGAIVPRLGPFGRENRIDPRGLLDPAMAAVPAAYLRDGRALSAVAGNGQEHNVVWGLFRNSDGSTPLWEQLVTLEADHALWCFASADGTTIYAGVQQIAAGGPTRTYLHRIDLRPAGQPAAPQVTLLPPPPPLVDGGDDSQDSPSFNRLVVHTTGTLLAGYTTATSGQLLAYDSAAGWRRLSGGRTGLPQGQVFGIDVDAYGGIYAATDDAVYFSAGIADTWLKVSGGLPQRAHLSHLCYSKAAGGVALYLSTFGRSLWRAHWPAPVLSGAGSGGWGWNDLIGSLSDGHLAQLGPHGLQPIPGPGPPPEVVAELGRGYQQLFTAIGDAAAGGRAALAELAPTAGDAAQMITNQVHARIDQLCQAAGILSEAAGPGASASIVTARRVHAASQAITQAAGQLTAAAAVLPEGEPRAGFAAAATALAGHISAMDTLAVAMTRHRPG